MELANTTSLHTITSSGKHENYKQYHKEVGAMENWSLPWSFMINSSITLVARNAVFWEESEDDDDDDDVHPCSEPLRDANLKDAGVLASFVILGLINVVVIGGNTLVVMAVFVHHKLRTVTNLFIVSLAVADLLVGLAVLPFSTAYEVLDVWLFGTIWCKMWLAVDVWLCTASILNLCVISLDRYLAVTRPVSYPNLMSPPRAKALIAGVWCVSFIICLPGLMTTVQTEPIQPVVISNISSLDAGANNSNTTLDSWTNLTSTSPRRGCKCELVSDRGYRIYAALGSFYLPMLVMMFFYWRIYRAAVETTRAINQGFKTTTMGGRFEEQRLTLRIHKGRSSTDFYAGGSESVKSNGTCSSHATTSTSSSFKQKEIKPSSRVGLKGVRTSVTFPPAGRGKFFGAKKIKGEDNTKSKQTAQHQWLLLNHGPKSRTNSNTSDQDDPTSSGIGTGDDFNSSTHQDTPTSGSGAVIARMGKRNIKAQVKRFRTETKAAKTLGIIVGGFILCWLPFFTIYLVEAFCSEGHSCIPHSLFSVFFWLGYCNSAVNPCVYALFSRDFRYAFKKILCRCTLREEVSIKERIVTMFPPTLHLSSFVEESRVESDSR
uniref:G-protein coupled receptors family 1 profile domain-containing protein n=1 Tax=Strigamia maritima TaxID=126957 RepID=T1IJG8_STRMM